MGNKKLNGELDIMRVEVIDFHKQVTEKEAEEIFNKKQSIFSLITDENGKGAYAINVCINGLNDFALVQPDDISDEKIFGLIQLELVKIFEKFGIGVKDNTQKEAT